MRDETQKEPEVHEFKSGSIGAMGVSVKLSHHDSGPCAACSRLLLMIILKDEEKFSFEMTPSEAIGMVDAFKTALMALGKATGMDTGDE